MINANPNSPRDTKIRQAINAIPNTTRTPAPAASEPCPSKSIMYENDNVDPAMPTIIITTPDSIITPKLALPAILANIFGRAFLLVVFH